MKRSRTWKRGLSACVCCLFAAQFAMAQGTADRRMSIDKTNAGLEEILNEVRENAGYKMFYNSRLLRERRATVRMTNATVDEILKKAFAGTGLTYRLENGTIVIRRAEQQSRPGQEERRRVQGTVVDKEGMPLAGATVRVEGQAMGAATDADGHFDLSIPSGTQRLEVSFIGMKTALLELTKRDHYVVTLEENSVMLSDVVATGYQTISRERATGSYSILTDEEMERRHATKFSSILDGLVAGAQGTDDGRGGTAYQIRGTGTMMADDMPLVVVDGFPLMDTQSNITGDNPALTALEKINPNDVESVTVLKDAAAASIWGARSANGVIVITTKSGKSGAPKVNFSTRITYSPKTDIDRLNLLDSNEKVDLELALLGTSYTYRENKGQVARIIAAAGETDAYKAGGWGALTSGTQAQINRLRSINTDWNDILFRNTVSQEYNLSVAGGNDKATYYTSVGYTDERGNVVGVEANRLNVTAKASYRLSRKLRVGASLFANRRVNKSNLTDADGFTNPVYYSRRANPYQTPFNEDGSYNYDVDIQGREDSELMFNIFEERDGTSYELETKSVTAIFDGDFRFNDSFKVTTQLGLQLDDSNKEEIADGNTYAMRKDIERTTLATLGGTSFLPDGGKKTASSSSQRQVTWKLQGEYSDRFADIHELELMAGTEIRKTWYESVSATGYGYDRKTLQTKPVIFPDESWAELYPLYSETYTENAFASFYATGSYTLKGRYTVGGSVRMDGSDMFGVAKKYRFLPLYSVSGLWRLSDEPFLADSEWLDNLAWRISYGIQGNIDKNTSSYVMGDYNNVTILPGLTEEIIAVSTPPNSRLRWEKTKTFSTGLDFGVLNNAINLSVDFYNRNGSDLIAARMLPLETGYVQMLVNWASMRNTGVEVTIASRNIHTADFLWTTNFNFAWNANKVLREEIPSNQTTPGREGYPVGALFALKSAGLDDEGYPLFYNKQGEKVTATELLKLNSAGASTLTAEEQRDLYSYIGSTDPLFSGGLMNTFTYKNWELSLNFIFNLKSFVRCTPSYSPANYDRGMNSNRDILDRWTPTNTNTSFPVLMNSTDRPAEYIQYAEYSLYSSLDTWVKRNDHVRLQNVRLAYTLPSEITKKASIERVTVGLEAHNLLVFGADYTNYLDPETMGNEFAQPIPRSFSFNLNVTF